MKRRYLLLAPLLLASCASIDAEQTTTVVGVIETVDPTSRELLLRGDAGSQSGGLLTVIAGRGVQRLNELRPGNRVTVRYYQALAAQVANPLSTAPASIGIVTLERTAARPGGEVTRVRSGRVTITAVDSATSTVSFTAPGGLQRTVTATNPEVQAFIRRLRVGQEVDMTYEEALAISIETAR